MAIYVRNGTPIHGPSLCETCVNAHIAKGYRASEELVMCDAYYPMQPVRFEVRECTHYADRTRQNLDAMKKIALVIRTADPKRVAGFVAANEGADEVDGIELIFSDES